MYTHASCFTLAEGHFLLKEMPLTHAPEEHPPEKRDRCALPVLSLRPTQDAPRSRSFFRAYLLAILLHMLCFGLLVAQAHYNWEDPGLAPEGQGPGEGAGIIVGNVVLSRFSVPGSPAFPGQEPQAKIPPVAPEQPATAIAQAPPEPSREAPPQKTRVTEESHSEATAEKTPAIPLQATAPKREKKQNTSRQADATGEGKKKNAAPGIAQDGQNATRAPDAGASGSGAANAGSAGGGAVGAGVLAPFGGRDGPSFKRFAQPEYPAQARRQGITGKVLLRIHITSEGVVDQIEVVQSAHDLLSKSAREAVERSTFHPLRRDGKTASCWTLLPISFSLERG